MITKSRYWYSIKKLIPFSLYETLLDIHYRLRAARYKGDAVECPICGRKFSSFVDGHACPKCGSGKRHRLMYLYLRERTNFFRDNLSVLHFAPEHCFYKRFASLPNLFYRSADLNSPRAMEKIDMTRIQYADNSFDVVLSSHVLEHVPDDRKAMKELFRVLKAGSWSIHQAPIDYRREHTFEDASIVTNDARLKAFGHIDHKRIYGRDYKDRLQQAGFEVKEDNFIRTFGRNEIKKFGLDEHECIYFCRKPVLEKQSFENGKEIKVLSESM